MIARLRFEFLHNGNKVSLQAEVLLMAIRITANTENLVLENTKIKFDRGHIATNGVCQIAEVNIYAIGDVARAPWLAHKTSHEGIVAIEHITSNKPHELNILNIPGGTRVSSRPLY